MPSITLNLQSLDELDDNITLFSTALNGSLAYLLMCRYGIILLPLYDLSSARALQAGNA